ncbi:hypothetical protein QT972_28920 [Microcoleus sp. herbarium7]|uniref:hypothetical protein n=1 Tax=Microcoleus sp. herbarium7 TaxID=3055435 RepID=UPI002FD530D1
MLQLSPFGTIDTYRSRLNIVLKSANIPATLTEQHSQGRSIVETNDGTTLFFQDWARVNPANFAKRLDRYDTGTIRD